MGCTRQSECSGVNICFPAWQLAGDCAICSSCQTLESLVSLSLLAVTACREVNRGGLEGLYRILLEDSGPWFAAAVRHISGKFSCNSMGNLWASTTASIRLLCYVIVSLPQPGFAIRSVAASCCVSTDTHKHLFCLAHALSCKAAHMISWLSRSTHALHHVLLQSLLKLAAQCCSSARLVKTGQGLWQR
jgi:hypothetical protein